MNPRKISLDGSTTVAEARASAPLLELFHENTKYTRSRYPAQALTIARELTSRAAIEALSRNFKVYRFVERRALGPPAEPAMPLGAALRARVSTREFTGASLSLADLASVLVPALACNRRAAVRHLPSVELRFRSYPSAGGEFPVEVYPILLRVAEVPPCVTHFDPRGGALNVLQPLDSAALEQALIADSGISRAAAALLVFTAVFERSSVKYGDRAYRLALLEAGHAAQNVCLTAAAAGIASLAWGGFFDDALNRLLGVDGLVEAAVHAVFLGHAREAAREKPA